MTQIDIENMDETERALTEGEPTDEQLEELDELNGTVDGNLIDPTNGEYEANAARLELDPRPVHPHKAGPSTERDADVEENEDELQKLDASVLDRVVTDILDAKEFGNELTMYQVAKALNTALELYEVEKKGEAYRVRPQMVYNYNRNKMVVREPRTKDGKTVLVGVTVERATKAQAHEFIVRFVSRLT